jgi:hypothetical protein
MMNRSFIILHGETQKNKYSQTNKQLKKNTHTQTKSPPPNPHYTNTYKKWQCVADLLGAESNCGPGNIPGSCTPLSLNRLARAQEQMDPSSWNPGQNINNEYKT